MKNFLVVICLIFITITYSYALEVDIDNNYAIDTSIGGTNTTDNTLSPKSISIIGDFGANIVANSDLNIDATGYTLPSDWKWINGAILHSTPVSTGTITLNNISVSPGTIYKIKFDIVGATAGSIHFAIGATTRYFISGNGSKEYLLKAWVGNVPSFQASGSFNGSIDNIEIMPLTSGGGMTLDGDVTAFGRIIASDGNRTSPSLTFSSAPGIGFRKYAGWDAVMFSVDGTDHLMFGKEGTDASLIMGLGRNRLTVEALNALVLRSQIGHIEFEGGTSSTFIEIVGYRAASSQGIPIIFKTDPTTHASPIVAVRGSSGQTGELLQVQGSGGSSVFSVDQAGITEAGGGSAGKAMCWKVDGKTLGYCSSVVAADGGCTCN